MRRVKKFLEKFVKKMQLFERSEFCIFRILIKILAKAQTVLIFASLFIKEKRQKGLGKCESGFTKGVIILSGSFSRKAGSG